MIGSAALGMQMLAEALKHNTVLTALDVAENELKAEGAGDAVAEARTDGAGAICAGGAGSQPRGHWGRPAAGTCKLPAGPALPGCSARDAFVARVLPALERLELCRSLSLEPR